MNGDVWRTQSGLVATEIGRRWIGRSEIVTVLSTDPAGSPWEAQRTHHIPASDLVPEPARYEGARGGRG